MQVLNADTSSIADDDGLGTLNYQWFRDGLGISGATNGSYTLGVNDIGASISVQVFYVDAHGTAESMGSAVVGPVGDVTIPPVPPTTGTSPDTTPRAEPPADTSPPETAAEEPAATTSAPLGTGDVAAPVPPPSGGVALPLDTVLGIEPSNVAGTSFVHDDSADSSQTPHQARLAPAGTGFNASYFAMQTTDLTVDQIPFVMTPTTALPSLDSGVNAIDAPEFSRELDRLRDSAEQQTRTAHTLVMTNFAATAGLSVGYLFWLLRTEVLLGSFLSSLPAWRLVDPLPVLGRLSDDDEDEDDESLESLVERRNREARPAEPENTGENETDIKAPEPA
jgi:hypothetical protein